MTLFDRTLGLLVEHYRKRKNLTQVALAKRTGISQSRISRIESGSASPTGQRVPLCSRLCSVATRQRCGGRRGASSISPLARQ